MTGSGVQEIGAGMWPWQHRPRGLRRALERDPWQRPKR